MTNEQKRTMRFTYHWLREYLRDQSIDNIRRKLRDLRRRIEAYDRERGCA